ncbi:hypothetical protein EDB81DRAFT_634830 [Dactylonectria macrodidyma]|uniref:Uncharacterized protein n=1 Tax=Dactylonectria macrodidyma TaxID=307937 RepID=A0A9P9FS42_9HYPO|nr:hypothetical protein EDB81DRAFT_634830 [Dactylonectria macrodidyma]
MVRIRPYAELTFAIEPFLSVHLTGFAAAEASFDFCAKIFIASRSQADVDPGLQRLKTAHSELTSSIRGHVRDLAGDQEEDLSKLFHLATDNITNLVDYIITAAGSLPNPITTSDATINDCTAASKYHFIGDLLLNKIGTKYLYPPETSLITFTSGAGTFKTPPG